MNKTTKRLKINHETVRQLSIREMANIAGGQPKESDKATECYTDDYVCHTASARPACP